MRTVYFTILLFIVVLFGSCEKEKMDIPDGKVRISVGVSIYNAFKNLRDAGGRPYFEGPLPGGHRMRVAAFLYRLDPLTADSLVDRKVAILENPQEDVHFQFDSWPGKYVVFTTADVVQYKEGELIRKYNDVIIGLNQPQIEIRFTNYGGVYNAAGISVSNPFDLRESGDRVNVILQARPTGSLVNLCFRGVGSGNADSYKLNCLYRHLTLYASAPDEVYNSIFTTSAKADIDPDSPEHEFRAQWYLVTPDSLATMSWGKGEEANATVQFRLKPGGSQSVRIDLATNGTEVADTNENVTEN